MQVPHAEFDVTADDFMRKVSLRDDAKNRKNKLFDTRQQMGPGVARFLENVENTTSIHQALLTLYLRIYKVLYVSKRHQSNINAEPETLEKLAVKTWSKPRLISPSMTAFIADDAVLAMAFMTCNPLKFIVNPECSFYKPLLTRKTQELGRQSYEPTWRMVKRILSLAAWLNDYYARRHKLRMLQTTPILWQTLSCFARELGKSPSVSHVTSVAIDVIVEAAVDSTTIHELLPNVRSSIPHLRDTLVLDASSSLTFQTLVVSEDIASQYCELLEDIKQRSINCIVASTLTSERVRRNSTRRTPTSRGSISSVSSADTRMTQRTDENIDNVGDGIEVNEDIRRFDTISACLSNKSFKHYLQLLSDDYDADAQFLQKTVHWAVETLYFASVARFVYNYTKLYETLRLMSITRWHLLELTDMPSFVHRLGWNFGSIETVKGLWISLNVGSCELLTTWCRKMSDGWQSAMQLAPHSKPAGQCFASAKTIKLLLYKYWWYDENKVTIVTEQGIAKTSTELKRGSHSTSKTQTAVTTATNSDTEAESRIEAYQSCCSDDDEFLYVSAVQSDAESNDADDAQNTEKLTELPGQLKQSSTTLGIQRTPKFHAALTSILTLIGLLSGARSCEMMQMPLQMLISYTSVLQSKSRGSAYVKVYIPPCFHTWMSPLLLEICSEKILENNPELRDAIKCMNLTTLKKYRQLSLAKLCGGTVSTILTTLTQKLYDGFEITPETAELLKTTSSHAKLHIIRRTHTNFHGMPSLVPDHDEHKSKRVAVTNYVDLNERFHKRFHHIIQYFATEEVSSAKIDYLPAATQCKNIPVYIEKCLTEMRSMVSAPELEIELRQGNQYENTCAEFVDEEDDIILMDDPIDFHHIEPPTKQRRLEDTTCH